MKLDTRGVLAMLVVVGSFVIVGAPYVSTGHSPDHDVLMFCSGIDLLVLGWYFGHMNGSQTALANSAVQLAQQAIEKRSTTVPVVAAMQVAPYPQPAAAPGPPTPAT